MFELYLQIISLFKTEDYTKPKRVKTTYGNGKKPNTLKIQKQSAEDNIIKNIRNFFKLKIENESMKDRIIRNIKIFFEKEDDYYKLIRISNFWNYIKYESSGNRNKNLSVKEYLDEVKPY